MNSQHPLLLFLPLLLLLSLSLILPIPLAQAAPPIKIGVSAPLTGDASTYGQDIKNVVLFANEKIGNGRFELIIEDDKCNGKDAVTAARKLVEIDKVKGVIGYGCSGALLAAAPVFNRAEIPAIGAETSAADITQAGKYIFRTQPSDDLGVKLLYDYVKTRHKTLGALSAQTDFCQGIIEDLKSLSRDGSLSLESEDFLNSETDFRTVLLKLKSKNIDALFANAQDEAGTYRIIKQAKELGFNGPFYTFYMGASGSFLSLAGKDAEGVISVDGPSFEDIVDAEGRGMFEEFVQKYGPMKAWTYGFATIFEAFRALSDALTKSDNPQEYLAKTSFQGMFGPYSFDENGDITGLTLVLKRNEEGKARPIK